MGEKTASMQDVLFPSPGQSTCSLPLANQLSKTIKLSGPAALLSKQSMICQV